MTVIVSESEPMTFVLGTVAMLMTLVLAWQGDRFHSREDRARKTAAKNRTGR